MKKETYVIKVKDGECCLKGIEIKDLTEEEITELLNKRKQYSIHDMTADEVIEIFKEAERKGRTYGWLESKLPKEIFEITQKSSSNPVFPLKLTKENPNAGVILEKNNIENRVDWSVINDVEEAQERIKEILKEEGVFEIIELSNIGKEKVRREIKDLENLFEAKGMPYLDYEMKKYRPVNLLNPSEEVKFNKREFISDYKNTMPYRRKYSGDYDMLIKDPKGKDITNNSQKVGPLTPEAEKYIRKILGGTTTEEIGKKRQYRYEYKKDLVPEYSIDPAISKHNYKGYNNKYLSSNDPIVEYNKEKKVLKELIYDLKRVTSESFGGFEVYGKSVFPGNRLHLTGSSKETLIELSSCLSKILISDDIDKVKENIKKAYELIEELPNKNKMINDIKQKIQDFLDKKRQRRKQMDSNYNIPLYVYVLPGLSNKDILQLEYFNLDYLNNNTIKGTRKDIKKFIEEHLGYELNADYLYLYRGRL